MLCVDRLRGKKTTGLDGRCAERVSNDQKRRTRVTTGKSDFDLTDWLVIRTILGW
jgi:hypothetical protein